MTLRVQIVEEAMRWRGAQWHHRALVPYHWCDCVRLLEGIAKKVGVLPLAWEPPVYSPEWQLHQHEEVLLGVLAELRCAPVTLDARQPGDILVFQYGRTSSHAGVLVTAAPESLVHAVSDCKRVVHHGLTGQLLARLRQVYAFPGVVE